MTDTASPRRRAPGMSPEQRRDMILQAAVPLVAELGSTVTTGQIARAAGIGEATIFRVFADKDELIRACIARALDPAPLLLQLRTIALEQPLDARLTEAAEALEGHLGRMGAVLGSLAATGHPLHRTPPPGPDDTTPPPPGPDDTTPPPSSDEKPPSSEPGGKPSPGGAPAFGPGGRLRGRDESQAATRAAIAELFEPDQDRLRVPAAVASEVFLGLLFARGRAPVTGGVAAADLVDLFLHGALAA